VDRGVLDREMAEHAARNGAEFLLKTSVCGIRDSTLITRGCGPHEAIPFRVLIAADGPRSTVARMLGMQRARVFLAGIQAEVRYDREPGLVEIYPDASPQFFGWAIPSGPGRARVGLCAKTGVPALFSAFIGKFDASSVELVTGTIPLGVMPKTFGHRTLFVGDAAGMAKPTSGGGVYTGVRAARHAAAVAAAACSQGRFDDAFLADYERRWTADFGTELAWGFRLFEMRQRIDGQTLDNLIRALDDPGILQVIEEYGDMDRPSTLAKKLLLSPGALRLVPALMQAGLHSLFS
jgi:flavin-dependent dehydrogenase